MKIGIILPKNSYMPDAHAYKDFLKKKSALSHCYQETMI